MNFRDVILYLASYSSNAACSRSDVWNVPMDGTFEAECHRWHRRGSKMHVQSGHKSHVSSSTYRRSHFHSSGPQEGTGSGAPPFGSSLTHRCDQTSTPTKKAVSSSSRETDVLQISSSFIFLFFPFHSFFSLYFFLGVRVV